MKKHKFMSNPFLHVRLFDKKVHKALRRDMLSDEFLFGMLGGEALCRV